jgi:diguanylate cyclase (GGDEF)-like protein
VGISVEVFSNMYEKVGKNLGEGAAVALYRKDKTLLTRWPLVSEMLGKVNTNNFIDRSLANAKINNGIIFASGAGFSRANETPVERMISYKAVDGYPFVVGAVVPEAIYLAGWYQNVFGVLLATTLSLIALFSGTYFFVTTYRKSAENQYRAHHDVLTELPNRTLFSDRLQTAIASSKRSKERFALLFVDLDNLKTINDAHSHIAGDEVLKEVAFRMKSILRESDTVARLGGDEFVVILPSIDNNDALRVAEKIRQSLLEPIEAEGHSLSTSASIGVAIYPIHGENEVDLMNSADVAMYEAKAAGRNLVRVYGECIANSVVQELA